MNMRTRRFVAHFSTPFRLTGVNELLPAGAYALDQEEELVAAGSGSGFVYRRVGMFMHLPAISVGRWTIRLVAVEPSDVETAILENMERQDGNPVA